MCGQRPVWPPDSVSGGAKYFLLRKLDSVGCSGRVNVRTCGIYVSSFGRRVLVLHGWKSLSRSVS